MSAGPRPHAATIALVLLVGAAAAVGLVGSGPLHLLGETAVVAVALLAAARPRASGRLPRAAVGALVVAIMAVLAALAAVASHAGTTSSTAAWRQDAEALTLVLWAGAAWAGARLLGPDASPTRWRTVHRAAALTALGAAVLALAGTFGPRQPEDGLVIGPLRTDPAELGVVGAVLLLTLLPVAVISRRPLPVAGVLAAAVALAASVSPSALLALLAGGVLLLLVLRSGRRPTTVVLLATAGLAAAAMLLPATAPPPVDPTTVVAAGTPSSLSGPRDRATRSIVEVAQAGGTAPGAQATTRAGSASTGAGSGDASASPPLGGVPTALVVVLAVVALVPGSRRARAARATAPTWALAGALAAVAAYATGVLTHTVAPGALLALLAGAVAALGPAAPLRPPPVAPGGAGGDGHERPWGGFVPPVPDEEGRAPRTAP